MALLFVIQDGRVFPTEECITIYPFSEIWKRDKTEKKDISNKEFGYIEFFCSYRKENPYAGYTDDKERHQKIVAGLFPDEPSWLPSTLVNDGIMVYQDFQLNASPSLKYYVSTNMALETLRMYWETLNMKKETKTGMLVNKPADVARGLKETAGLLAQNADLLIKVQQELLTNSKTRGNRIINHFEK